jgi:dethiobiotin synthetase
MNRGFFIASTAPRVGKTVVACAITSALRQRALKVAVMKPVQTGCPLKEHSLGQFEVGGMPGPLDQDDLAILNRLERVAGPPPPSLVGRTPRESLLAQDALQLLRASGAHPTEETLDQVNPYRFAPALEPAVAARAAEEEIDPQLILQRFHRLRSEADIIIVEGHGGLMAPLTEDQLMLSLVAEMSLPVLLVSPSEPGQCISPSLLNVEVCRSRGLTVAGIIINRLTADPRPEEAANPYQLDLFGRNLVRGVLPFFSDEVLQNPPRYRGFLR